MAITQNTKDADDKLRKELQKADIDKFKKAIKQGFLSSGKHKPKKK